MAAPSGSTVGSNSDGPGTSYDRGVPLNLASYHEWEISEIGYDGTEKFKIPHGYQEHIGALARKIDWMSLIGEEARHDNLVIHNEKEKGTETAAVDAIEETKKKSDERTPPEAGPWHVVAKHLHASLQELTVLLDDLAILRTTDYLKPMRVADRLQDANMANEVTAMVQNSKAFQWSSKRKALNEAANVFETAIKTRNNQLGSDDASRRNKDRFFSELRRMRELWRVRKNGESIIGDLGYKIFGIKSDPRGVFHITRRSADQMKASGKGEEELNVLQVSVPGDLMRQSTLTVSIVKDDGSITSVFPEKADSEYAYMEMDKAACDGMPWEKSLKRAQETLICKDIFNILFQEAVQLRRRLAVVKEGVIMVSLYDDYLLRFELKFHPFTMDSIPTEGDPFLTRFLREYHLAMECSRPVRPQMLIDLPLTHLPEALDYRGPLAYSAQDIEARSAKAKGLLNRMTKVSGHYVLVKRTIAVLKSHQLHYGDPTLRWRCIRCSPLHSLFLCELNNRNYEHIAGKLSFYVQVDAESVEVQTKEGTEISCRRDEHELRQALHLMSATHEMISVSQIAKQISYQVLHANMNAMDENGVPCPTLYLVNNVSTRTVYIKFPLGEVPQTYVRNFIADERMATEEEKKFTSLNFSRMPGRSLCKKFDTLFSLLKN
ncbi:mdt-17 [Pristionchus pacificus]|uniref:Mdt-17 n=1 Tax=Pristionchus pacificus TaxID=54126 RepID=A0A2A6CG47_PRIPA|nr:mdt-17 [Pristionchus pacificus]|eukprot:PDM77195.1 mdt-17 [Pristionchus pacificus]